MSSALREVYLHGELGRRFGRVFRLQVASAGEAARALAAQLPGFRKAFVGPDGQQRYHVLVGRGRERLDESRKDEVLGSAEPIRFVPVVAGAKRQGAGQTILGAVLVIVGVVINMFTLWTGGNQLIFSGLAMMVGGISQMMAAQRKPGERPENQPSYGMDAGALNTVEAGGPVPLAFGRVVIGSVQISAGLTTEALGNQGQMPGGGYWGDGWGGGNAGGSKSLPGWETRDPFVEWMLP